MSRERLADDCKEGKSQERGSWGWAEIRIGRLKSGPRLRRGSTTLAFSPPPINLVSSPML